MPIQPFPDVLVINEDDYQALLDRVGGGGEPEPVPAVSMVDVQSCMLMVRVKRPENMTDPPAMIRTGRRWLKLTPSPTDSK